MQMIDLVEAKEQFENYVENYDSKNPKIDRKVKHSYRVIDVAEEIANSLNLSEEDVKLAKLIALLHDIGRFEQIRIYDTFSDKESVDHANLGVEILFNNNLIRKFIRENEFDEIIYKAIKNHNKYKIEEGLNNRELLHAKIIRDADKTDIYEVFIREIEQNENALFDFEELPKQKISEKVLQAIKAKKLVNSLDIRTDMDKYIKNLAFVFDYNYKKGLEIVKERKYIKKLINRVKNNDNEKVLNEMNNIINNFIDEQ